MNHEEAAAWIDAAMSDGWIAEPMYRHEPINHAARLTRQGFVASVMARPHPAQPGVILWCPDGLQIKTPPGAYSWEAIVAGTRACNECGATDVDTFRYSFAGRCCAACLPAMRKKHEKPGWCD